MDYAFMFSAIESCDINRLSLETYLRKLILSFHEKKVEKKQLLPCYIRLYIIVQTRAESSKFD